MCNVVRGILVALGFTAWGPAAAADPVADVLALVPADPAICLIVRDSGRHFDAIATSPMAGWVRGYLSHRLTAADAGKLRLAEAFLTGPLGLTLDQLRTDILGDAIVFAYTPGPPGRPAADTGVVYIKPRVPATLRKLVGRLDALQTASGEITSTDTHSHGSGEYVARAKAGGGADYYAFRDSVFAFSSQEAAVKDFLARTPRPADAPTGVAADLTALGLADRLAVCLFRPRAFDAELAAKAVAAKEPGEAAFLTQFAKVWGAADAIAVYAHPGRDLDLGVAATVRVGKLPAEIQALRVARGGASSPAMQPSSDALFSVGGRISLPALLAAVGLFLPPEEKAKLTAAIEQNVGPAVGRDKLSAVLAGIGPDWAAWVELPAAGTWVPQWTAAVRLSDPGIGPAVAQALDLVAQTARFEYNRTHPDQLAAAETPRPGGGVVKSLGGPGLPAGFAPSYAVADGYVVFGGSADRVGGSAMLAGASQGANAPRSPADVPVARLSVVALRQYLAGHREEVATWLARRNGRTAAVDSHELREFEGVLAAFESVELHHIADAGRVRLSLRVRFVQPLAK